MNFSPEKLEFDSIETGIENLKTLVSIRDKMGGALYFNILNDDCCEIANKLARMGADKGEIGKILGNGNFS